MLKGTVPVFGEILGIGTAPFIFLYKNSRLLISVPGHWHLVQVAQIDSNGVTGTVSCQAIPIPKGRVAGIIGAYAVGFDADKSYNDSICYCNGENGNAGRSL